VKILVVECPKKTCRFRWRPRVDSPKECPNCKHRFTADWGLKPKTTVYEIKSREEFLKLLEEIKKWNEQGRWEAP